jgi:uncharacterized membrane protein
MSNQAAIPTILGIGLVGVMVIISGIQMYPNPFMILPLVFGGCLIFMAYSLSQSLNFMYFGTITDEQTKEMINARVENIRKKVG